jgi:hypothetical protein
MSDGKPFFDRRENQPYGHFLERYQFPWAVNAGLELLNNVQRSNPTDYATPKGTPFYFIGIAAFASHDYQTATFFFDAAVAEDVTHYAGDNDKPALLFMRLDKTAQGEAARQVVDLVVAKLDAALRDYAGRKASRPLTFENVRDYFLNHLGRPHLRTLTTTFVSFLAEWDYRLQMIDLPLVQVSREPFFMHLFRGCLLFESLLRDKAPPNPPELWPAYVLRLFSRIMPDSWRAYLLRRFSKTVSHTTLGPLLRLHRKALGIGKVKTSSSSFEKILGELRSREPLQAAIQCTARTRNTLGHDLAWAAQSLNRQSYNLLASSIAASCLHAIACLYLPPRP